VSPNFSRPAYLPTSRFADILGSAGASPLQRTISLAKKAVQKGFFFEQTQNLLPSDAFFHTG